MTKHARAWMVASIACVLAMAVLPAGDACASGVPTAPVVAATGAALSTAQTFCQTQITNGTSATPPTFINPLMACFLDPSQGYVPSLTQTFLDYVQAYFTPMLIAMMTVALAFFGFKLAMANLERPNSETFTLLLKIGGVCYFYTHSTFYYKYLLAILQYCANLISMAAVSMNQDAFCNDAADYRLGNGTATLWGRWDCLFNYIFGFYGPELAVGGIAGFLLEMLMSSGYTGNPTGNVADFVAGSGILLVVIALYAIFALFYACMRFIHLYLMAVLAMSFIYCFGYIFVPLMLFRGTMQYFRQWLAMILSFLLTPMLLMAFMGMTLVAVDIAVFSGNYSVWKEVTGQTATANPDGIVNMTGMTVDKFRPFMFNLLNNQNCGAGGVITPEQVGGLGPGHDCNQTEAQMNNDTSNPGRPFSSNIGLDTTGLNLTQAATTAGAGSVGQYLENVLISFAVASLLAYIMYTLIRFIPELSQQLVSQNIGGRFGGFGGGGGRGLGQGTIGNVLGNMGNSAMATMRNAAGGGSTVAQARTASELGTKIGGR